MFARMNPRKYLTVALRSGTLIPKFWYAHAKVKLNSFTDSGPLPTEFPTKKSGRNFDVKFCQEIRRE